MDGESGRGGENPGGIGDPHQRSRFVRSGLGDPRDETPSLPDPHGENFSTWKAEDWPAWDSGDRLRRLFPFIELVRPRSQAPEGPRTPAEASALALQVLQGIEVATRVLMELPAASVDELVRPTGGADTRLEDENRLHQVGEFIEEALASRGISWPLPAAGYVPPPPAITHVLVAFYRTTAPGLILPAGFRQQTLQDLAAAMNRDARTALQRWSRDDAPVFHKSILSESAPAAGIHVGDERQPAGVVDAGARYVE